MNDDIKRYMSLLETKTSEPEEKKFSTLIESEQVEELDETSLAEQLEAMMEMDYHEDLADIQNTINTAMDLMKQPLIRVIDKVEDLFESFEQAEDMLIRADLDIPMPANPEETAAKAKINALRHALANVHNEMKKVFEHLTAIGMSMDIDSDTDNT